VNEPWLVNGARIDFNIPNAHLLNYFAVNSLLHPLSKSWNEDIIHQIFDFDTAAQILQTPLFAQVADDRLIWKAERNGVYSVKSAYHLCVEELVDTSHFGQPGFWSGIWRLKVPPKVKIWCGACVVVVYLHMSDFKIKESNVPLTVLLAKDL